MSQGRRKENGHAFSVELKSKEHLKRFSIPNSKDGEILMEGSLGELKRLELVEGVMMEARGVNGVLRMELSNEELRRLLACRSHPQGESSPTLVGKPTAARAR
jgi:hypothetical protein